MVAVRHQSGYTSDIAEADHREFGDRYGLAVSDSEWWAGYDGGRLVAFCGLESLEQEPAGFLCRSWVAPSHRGRRLQARMIRVREARARQLGLERMVTYTAYENCRSANSLIRCGYRMYAPQHLWGCKYSNYWFKIL